MKERYLLEDGGDNSFSLITDYDGNDEQAFDVNVKSGEILPVFLLFLWKSDARLPVLYRNPASKAFANALFRSIQKP